MGRRKVLKKKEREGLFTLIVAVFLLWGGVRLVTGAFGYVETHAWVREAAIIVVLGAMAALGIAGVLVLLQAIEKFKSRTAARSVVAPLEMTPTDYEQYCAGLLEKCGWNAKTTAVSGDQGADVVAELESIKLVIQCKRYVQPVGNKAVQEVMAAKVYYGANVAAVVATAPYTQSAIALAKKSNVLLLSHVDLPQLNRTLLR